MTTSEDNTLTSADPITETTHDGSGSGDYWDYSTLEPETRDPSYYDTKDPSDYETVAPEEPTTTTERTTTQAVSTTLSDQEIRCKHLNEIRANYTICCKYPGLVANYADLEICQENCTASYDPRYDPYGFLCCANQCVLEALSALECPEDESEKCSVNSEGLVMSFMLSVGNDTVWEPVIRASVERCVLDTVESEDSYNCARYSLM